MKSKRLQRTMRALALALGLATLGGAATAEAATFINRGLNLPNGQFELGLGLGLGHRSPIGYNGLGLNFELGYGLTSALELRARSGIRFGQAGRSTDADAYGRAVETETYNLGGKSLANPDIGLRFNLVRGGTAEIALDARIQIPVDPPLGLIVGLPVALHLGRLRLDTGLHIPMRFHDSGTTIDISVPIHLWIKLKGGTFVGPMTGVIWQNDADTRVPFGLGVGTPLAYDADLRFWLLFRDVDQGSNDFGVGGGLYVQF
jgi:hypothetical protein